MTENTADRQPRGRLQGVDELLVNLFSEVCDDNGANSEQAFAELYDITSARLYGLVLRVVRTPETAAAITQEVYMEVWRHALRWSSEKGSVRAWMHGIARRKAANHVPHAQTITEKHTTLDEHRPTGRA